MKILAVDTATGTCSVALLFDGRIVAESLEEAQSRQAERLLPMIENILAGKSLPYDDIDLFVSSIGPGSFTGLRIGMSAIKGFSLTTGATATGINTLEMAAYKAMVKCSPIEDKIIVFIDAKREQLYTQSFSYNIEENSIKAENTPMLIDVIELNNLVQNTSGSCLITGDCPELLTRVISEKKKCRITDKLTPHAKYAAMVAYDNFNKGILTELTPLYIRKPDAKKASQRPI